eukprot:SAG11_NODE_941_length_6455_cov_5.508181_3_plen_126_part_00
MGVGKSNPAAADEPPPLTQEQHGMKVGDRVQTQYTVEEGGDDSWYPGTIIKIMRDGRVKIKYPDDGSTWTGDARYVMSLTDGAAPMVASTVMQVIDSNAPVVAATHAIAPVQASVVEAHPCVKIA